MERHSFRTISGDSLKSGQIVGNMAKWRILKRVFQKQNKARQIFLKTNISYLLIRTSTCAYQRVRNVRFSQNLACFVFLKHPIIDSPFCHITDKIAVFYTAKVMSNLQRRMGKSGRPFFIFFNWYSLHARLKSHYDLKWRILRK